MEKHKNIPKELKDKIKKYNYSLYKKIISEKDKKIFKRFGYRCFITRTNLGHLCGYVEIPKHHFFYKKNYHEDLLIDSWILKEAEQCFEKNIIKNINKKEYVKLINNKNRKKEQEHIDCIIEVHGGITYSNNKIVSAKKKDVWYFGFDAAHHLDLVPSLCYDLIEKHNKEHTYKDMNYMTKQTEKLAKQLYIFDAIIKSTTFVYPVITEKK